MPFSAAPFWNQAKQQSSCRTAVISLTVVTGTISFSRTMRLHRLVTVHKGRFSQQLPIELQVPLGDEIPGVGLYGVLGVGP